MSISWRPQMAVDHGMIDDDHRIIIAISNEFIAIDGALPTAAELLAILRKLKRYTLSHLDREQKLQKEIRYPYADAHEYQHKDLIKRLDNMKMKFKKEQTQEELAANYRSVAELLRTWFIDHIIHSDLRMRPFAAVMRRLETGIVDLSRAVVPAPL